MFKFNPAALPATRQTNAVAANKSVWDLAAEAEVRQGRARAMYFPANFMGVVQVGEVRHHVGVVGAPSAGKEFIHITCTILESTSHPELIGKEAQYSITFGGYSGFSDLKAFVIAASGADPSNADHVTLLEENGALTAAALRGVCDTADAAGGARDVKLNLQTRLNKSGKFTKHIWTPCEQPAA